MPLPDPVARREVHRRAITCHGYQREDGLWDIEARMVDTKTDSVEQYGREPLPAGKAFHDVSLRLTIDIKRVIHEAEASIDAAPFDMCPDIVDAFKNLKGIQIGPGWRKRAAEQVGGTLGCTHVNELLPVIATTSLQTLAYFMDAPPVSKPGAKAVLNTCHSWSQSSPLIKKLAPELYIEAPTD